jgi:hypothetical protein
MASYFELDLLRLSISLYTRRYSHSITGQISSAQCLFIRPQKLGMVSNVRINIGEGRPHTRSVLSAADFNELLDIGDFFWHRGEN